MSDLYVLVVNCGSSSIKLALLDPVSPAYVWDALVERLGTADARMNVQSTGSAPIVVALPNADHAQALDAALDRLPALPIAGIGHRVVHGGESFSESVLLDRHVIDAIEACAQLAPLHNPVNLIGIRTALRLRPDLGQVAVFDTAFHQSMPPRAYLYALPYRLYERHKVRRYGFHGTSHRYVAHAAAALMNRRIEELNLISAHLGNGASATAIAGGRSVDTTMGLTPLEGLVMGTRSGDVDPNLHGFLVEHADMKLEAVSEMLNKHSGLLGVSGHSSDMRDLLALERGGHARASLAIELFCYRLAKALLGLSAALSTLDAIIFTGGIGENSAPVRARTVRLLGLWGIELDNERNAVHGKTSAGTISTPTSRVAVLVVPTHEELAIAHEVMRLVPSAS